jgi:CRISPR-associated protein Csb1
MDIKLDLAILQSAVSGSAAAFRCRRRLQPAGGEGDKVFPPTFAGAVYALERRRVPGREDSVTCVLLDSVQSQANRMELALQEAVDAGKIRVPIVSDDLGRGCGHVWPSDGDQVPVTTPATD